MAGSSPRLIYLQADAHNVMRALIIDDERLARSELRRLLTAHREIEIVGEAANIEEAEREIGEKKPDIIFLDVQMPGGSGFDLLAALDATPEVIFTTAFDQYAFKAFEVNALDYLQKPIEAQRLAAALTRASERVLASGQKADEQKSHAPLAIDNKIFIKDGERCWFVKLAQIALFESEGNYTRVYFEDAGKTERPLVLRSLNQLEERLDERQFFRANRRHIVNLNFVARVTPSAAGGLNLVLANDVAIEVSRRRALEFKAVASL
jgi:two-component system, LytTR family, response regulator